MTTETTVSSSLLPATVSGPSAPAAGGETGPHWHMPVDSCDHRTYSCRGCCPHGDDAD